MARPPPDWTRDVPGNPQALWYKYQASTANTRLSHSYAVDLFLKFCGQLHLALHFPAHPSIVDAWAASLGGSVAPRNIRTYITALRSWHIDPGLPFEGFTDFVARTLQGIGKFYGLSAPKRAARSRYRCCVALSVRPPGHFGGPHAALQLIAAFCLAFARFLRGEESTYDAPFDHRLHFSRGCLVRHARAANWSIHLPAAKPDLLRIGNTVRIYSTGNDACAVRALQDLLSAWPSTSSDQALFNRPGRGPRCLIHQGLRGGRPAGRPPRSPGPRGQ